MSNLSHLENGHPYQYALPGFMDAAQLREQQLLSGMPPFAIERFAQSLNAMLPRAFSSWLAVGFEECEEITARTFSIEENAHIREVWLCFEALLGRDETLDAVLLVTLFCRSSDKVESFVLQIQNSQQLCLYDLDISDLDTTHYVLGWSTKDSDSTFFARHFLEDRSPRTQPRTVLEQASFPSEVVSIFDELINESDLANHRRITRRGRVELQRLLTLCPWLWLY